MRPLPKSYEEFLQLEKKQRHQQELQSKYLHQKLADNQLSPLKFTESQSQKSPSKPPGSPQKSSGTGSGGVSKFRQATRHLIDKKNLLNLSTNLSLFQGLRRR